MTVPASASDGGAVGPVVAVLGSANMDLVVRMERLPEPGETIFGSSFRTVPGGKGLNQAVAAARAGARVEFLGAVGSDGYGVELRSLLEAEGIGSSGLATVPGETGTAHISVLDSGENSIVVVSGANSTVLSLTDAQRALIESSDYLVMQFELPVPVLIEAAAVARAAGTTTVLTPAPVIEFDRALLGSIDLLVPNHLEAQQLAGVDGVEAAAEALSAATSGSVVVTLGAEGSLRAQGGAVTARVPARRVEAVDTTSAGDTFVGVLVARLAAGDDFATGLRWASVGSSIGVTRPGATSSMPTWAEIAAVGIGG